MELCLRAREKHTKFKNITEIFSLFIRLLKNNMHCCLFMCRINIFPPIRGPRSGVRPLILDRIYLKKNIYKYISQRYYRTNGNFNLLLKNGKKLWPSWLFCFKPIFVQTDKF